MPRKHQHPFRLIDGSKTHEFDTLSDMLEVLTDISIGPAENGGIFTVEIKHPEGPSPKMTPVMNGQVIIVFPSVGEAFRVIVPEEVNDIDDFLDEHFHGIENWEYVD